MIPLTLCNLKESNIINSIKGNDEMRNHLLKLGFVPGSEIIIVSRFGNNLIVNIKESRIAISAGMANKIMV